VYIIPRKNGDVVVGGIREMNDWYVSWTMSRLSDHYEFMHQVPAT